MGFSFEEIIEKYKVITSSPIKEMPDATLTKYKKKIAERTPKSQQLWERAVKCIPGGYQHQLMFKQPHGVTMAKARGSKQWDIDGNEYVDFLMAAGPIILGHNYPPIVEKLQQILPDEGNATAWTSEFEIQAIESIKKHMPSIDLFKFFQSGTEADMAAIRLARVYTDKKKIIRVGGAYHGWSDQMVYDMHIPHSGPLEAHGIPSNCWRDILSVPPNNLDALDEAFKKADKYGGAAAMIVEPLGGESGAIPAHPDYHKICREKCDEHGSLLIFDEVVTGFRLAMGGAQEYYGIKADISTYGKVLTHGYPSSGGMGGRQDVMECLVAGIQPGKERAFSAGTISGNPLTSAACYWTLLALEETNAIQKTARTADKLTKDLNDMFERLDLPNFAYNFGSIFHFESYSPAMMDIRQADNIPKAIHRKDCVDKIGLALFAEGLITKYGNRGFTCLAHTPEDGEKLLSALESVLKTLQ